MESHVWIFNPFSVYFCVWCRKGRSLLLLPVDIQFPQNYLLKKRFFPLAGVGVLSGITWDHLTVYAKVYFWALCSVLLVYMSVFMPAPCLWLLFCIIFLNQEMWHLHSYCSFSGLFWLLGVHWDSIGILGWIFFLFHQKRVIVFFKGIALTLQITLGSILTF